MKKEAMQRECMNKRVSGFTLLELLVVIATIGILALLLFSGFKEVSRRSETVMCISSMRKIGTALNAFRADYDGWFPPGYPVGGHSSDWVTPVGGLPPKKPLHYYLIGYLTEVPLADGRTLDQAAILDIQNRTDLPFCPSNMGGFSSWHHPEVRKLRIWGSYSINGILGAFRMDSFPPTIKNLEVQTETGETKLININPITRDRFDPSRYPMLVETRTYGPENYSAYSHSMAHLDQAIKGQGSWWTGETYPDPGRSHGPGDALNFLFIAGNVETIGRNDDRDVNYNQKSWIVSATNPKGMFHSSGEVPAGIPGRNQGDKVYFPVAQFSSTAFKALYPHLSSFQIE
jgi:prepilin-type N-terminal cleavage/methylation domain-containing protein